jgi:flagellar biogenesis protein FliO
MLETNQSLVFQLLLIVIKCWVVQKYLEKKKSKDVFGRSSKLFKIIEYACFYLKFATNYQNRTIINE